MGLCAALLVLYAYSMVIAAKPETSITRENKALLEISNLTYGQCIKLDTIIWNSCINESKVKLESCNLVAGNDTISLEACKEGFKADKKSCKNSFKSIKDTCASNRKTLFEVIKEKF